jgi:DNA-binding GntR family transcriptional regulator
MTTSWGLRPAPAVTDQAYEAIRDRILRGELQPGALLRQEELSRAMGVSRTPVREALMRLVSDGYVERLHRRGFRVAGGMIRDLVALYPILATLERLACETAFHHITTTRLSELERVNSDIRRATDRGDARAAIARNQEFHRLLCEQCDNPRLIRLLDELTAEVMRLEIWSFASESDREQTLRDHDEILAALRRHDYAKALDTLTRDRMSAHEAYHGRLRRPREE